MARALCLDASVLVKLFVEEEDSPAARELVAAALREGAVLVEPDFLTAEALSVVRKRLVRGELPSEDAEWAVESLLALPVERVGDVEAYRRAWEIAGEVGLPVVYDAVYLAVAERRSAAFWTADRALYARVGDRGYVHLLGAGR